MNEDDLYKIAENALKEYHRQYEDNVKYQVAIKALRDFLNLKNTSDTPGKQWEPSKINAEENHVYITTTNLKDNSLVDETLEDIFYKDDDNDIENIKSYITNTVVQQPEQLVGSPTTT